MEAQILSWLSKTGYPLELYVQQTVLARGYLCEKSPLYSDVESGIAREVDVTAYNHGTYNDDYGFDFQILFECKKSEDPLIVLCNGQEKKERFNYLFGHETIDDGAFMANWHAYFHLCDLTHEQRHQTIGQFSEAVYAGHSIVPAFKGSDEKIYKGIMGLSSAYEYYRGQHSEFFLAARNMVQTHVCDQNNFQLQLAVLLVDAPLFTARLDENGQTTLTASDWVPLLVRLPWTLGKSDEERLCNIQVVKKEALNSFLDAVEQFHKYISRPEIVEPAIKRTLKGKTQSFLEGLFQTFGQAVAQHFR